MNSSKSLNRLAVGIVCVLAVVLCAVSVFTGGSVASAADETSGKFTYFYEELSELSQTFYGVIGELETSGDLKDGLVSYNLVENGVVTEAQVEDYVRNGNTTLPVAFSAARDAYLLENPSLFYIDLYKLVFSAGKKDGHWVALIDTGNYENCYADGGFTSEAQVDAAITAYNTKLSEAAASASTATTEKDKVAAVNAYIVANVAYDYDAYDTYVNSEQATTSDDVSVAIAYSSTAYGALNNSLAVCSGYSKAFKAVLDELNIPCVCVQGYSRRPGNDSAEPHMWNYVKLDGKWYAVDATWNDTGSTPRTNNARAQVSASPVLSTRYLLVGSNKLMKDHTTNGVISSSNFEFYYPKLNAYDYGTTEDENGFAIGTNYVAIGEATGLDITVSYKGLGAEKLEEQGLYMVFRYEYEDYTNHEWTVSNWNQITKYNQYMPTFEIEDSYIATRGNTYMTNIQFAIFNKESDGLQSSIGFTSYIYNPATLNTTDVLVDYSKIIVNDAYGTYVAPPYPVQDRCTPSTTEILDHGTYNVKIVYDEKLVKVDPNEPVGVRLSTVFNDMEGKYTISDIAYDDATNTLSFTFTPSMMYHHNQTHYTFYPTNLLGENLGDLPGKLPVGASWCFEYPVPAYNGFVGCQNPNHFAKVYGQPQLISDENLAESGFEGVLGTNHSYNTDQRAQILLVVTNPNATDTQNMQDKFAEETGASTTDVKATATYEIGMDVCGGACKQVPDGWKLQIGVGFPYKDFDYTDTSIVYKAYHYRRDANGVVIEIEEISCIVTPLGLVIDVDSFSPFMIVALDAESALAQNTAKQVFAKKLTDGGKVVEKTSGKNKIFQVEDSITYELTPETGYSVDKVFLNGTALSADKYADGNLTLSASELGANNTLDVYFISDAVVARYEAANIEVEQVSDLAISDANALKADASAHTDTFVPTVAETNFVKEYAPNPDLINGGEPSTGNNNSPSNVGLIVGCVIGAVVLVAVVVVALLVIKKNKKPKRS